MARAKWEQTALLAVMFHNNGFNRPIRDASIFNPYADHRERRAESVMKTKMTLAELTPMLKRALG